MVLAEHMTVLVSGSVSTMAALLSSQLKVKGQVHAIYIHIIVCDISAHIQTAKFNSDDISS